MGRKPSHDEILAGVLADVRTLLDELPDAPVAPTALLVDDLGFTSLDLLELIFLLERRFGVTIGEGTLYRIARGELADADFVDEDGILTELGRSRVMALLHDSPPAVFPAIMHRSTIPLYATVAAVARLVEAVAQAGPSAGPA